MANKIKGKGTALQVTISTVLTAVAALTECAIGETKPVLEDVPTLDTSGAGIPREWTGWVEQGDVTCSGYYDPDDATHQFLTDTALAPTDVACKIIFTDGTPSEATFTAAGFGVSVSAPVQGFVTFDATIQTDGYVTWPT